MSTPTSRLRRFPITCTWQLTRACNLRCADCDSAAGRQAKDELTTEECLSLATDLVRAGCRRVTLTGGEVLIRKDWSRIAERLSAGGLEVGLVTNGLLVKPETVARMIEAGVVAATVSLDGSREVHDRLRRPASPRAGSRYDAALRAIEQIRQSPLTTVVASEVHQLNIDMLEQMYETLVELGVDAWQLQLALPLGRTLELPYRYLIEPQQLPWLMDRLAALVGDGRLPLQIADNVGYYSPHEPALRGSGKGRLAVWYGCMAGCRIVAICANGDVKGCPSHPPSFVVGNVREEGFSEIWAAADRFSYNTQWRAELLEGGCARCPYGKICRAGCTTMAFALTGTIYDNPLCYQRVTRVGAPC